jgi:hypothetical protein
MPSHIPCVLYTTVVLYSYCLIHYIITKERDSTHKSCAINIPLWSISYHTTDEKWNYKHEMIWGKMLPHKGQITTNVLCNEMMLYFSLPLLPSGQLYPARSKSIPNTISNKFYSKDESKYVSKVSDPTQSLTVT